MDTDSRLDRIESALNEIDLQTVKELFPNDETYKLKEKLMFLEEQAKSEFKTLKESPQNILEALSKLKSEAEIRDKTLEAHTVKLQEELKSMQEVGNQFAKDLSEQEKVEWKEQHDLLNTQFTSISEEFNKH